MGLKRTRLYGIITSPYPEATLISFSFLIWDHLGPNMADNWFADQLIGYVGLGARAVSRKTPIYFICQISHSHGKRILSVNEQQQKKKVCFRAINQDPPIGNIS